MAERENEREKRWSLVGATALVTGGTKGIGHSIAEELASLGARVHVCSRTATDVEKCLTKWRSLGFRVTGSVCDVSAGAEREKLMEEVASLFDGKLNILVNNAGIYIMKPTVECTTEDYSTMIATNLESSFHLSQLAHPLLKASEQGNIILISSVAGQTAMSNLSIYGATKETPAISTSSGVTLNLEIAQVRSFGQSTSSQEIWLASGPRTVSELTASHRDLSDPHYFRGWYLKSAKR